MGRARAEQIEQRRVQIDVGGERVARARRHARPRDQQRRVADRLPQGDGRLAPGVLLAEIVSVIGAHDHGRVVPQSLLIERVEHPAEPMVDHRELRAVAGPDLARLTRRQHAARQTRARVGRPDQMRAFPIRVVARGPGLGRIEGLVRIELVDEEQEALVVRRVIDEPARGRSRAFVAPGSPPRRGTSRGNRRRACVRVRTKARRATTDPDASSTRRPRVRVDTPRP